MIPDRFCKKDQHSPVFTVSELIEALKELPGDLAIDADQTVPLVFNSRSESPFFSLGDPEDFLDY
jgi:hypothetical protein